MRIVIRRLWVFLFVLIIPFSVIAEEKGIEDSRLSFTQELWEGIGPVYRAILSHPFLEALVDGTLPEETFRFYMIQDALYLRKFSQALALLSAKAPKEEWALVFAEHARDVLINERDLHMNYFHIWGLSDQEIYDTPQAPAGFAYSLHELSTAQSGSFEEILGALLPCYWIYWNVGKTLAQKKNIHPRYKRWIDLYSDDSYGTVADQVLAILEEAVLDLPESRRKQVRENFYISTRFEWMFWDAAWHREPWPKFVKAP